MSMRNDNLLDFGIGATGHAKQGIASEREEKGGSETTGQVVLSELDRLVSVERLREIIWEEESRPSIQWLRKETKRRMLPHIRRGRLIFYRPRSVIEWYAQRESRPASMK
jgi:hypothetical protein